MPGPNRYFIAALLVLLSARAVLAQGGAEEERRRLDDIETRIEAGEARKQELDRTVSRLKEEGQSLTRKLVATTGRVRAKESEVTYLEKQLADLNLLEQGKAGALDVQRGHLVNTLAALQRLSRQPDATHLTRPGTAIETVRSAMLMGAIVPELRVEARRLGAEIAALHRVRSDITRDKTRLDKATKALQRERREVGRLVSLKSRERKHAAAQASAEAARVTKLAAQARDIRELLEKLRRQPPKVVGPRLGGSRSGVLGATVLMGKPFSTARGALPLPARGRLVEGFGVTDESGGKTKGITIETRPLAQVITPYDGRILFAGLFRGYGQLLIIAHGEGYHTLLAGISRINGIVGQWVLAGEPVGQMGSDSKPRPRLYVELRHNGEPLNPLPWLSASERKVSG